MFDVVHNVLFDEPEREIRHLVASEVRVVTTIHIYEVVGRAVVDPLHVAIRSELAHDD